MDYLSTTDHARIFSGMAMRWRIDELLTERGWTAYRLAKEAGLTPSAIYKLRKKRSIRFIEMTTLHAIARAFGLTGDEIWTLLQEVPEPRRVSAKKR